MSGHAYFAEPGKDIVCAGASAVAIGAVNAIEILLGVKADEEQGEAGFIRCTYPDNLPEDVQDKVQLLLEAMVVSLQEIEKVYGKHIKLTFKK
jgi:uncharacterized protein YsxB (DUF464 family)